MRRLMLITAAIFLLIGNSACIQSVFHKPITLSTKAVAGQHGRLIKPVSAESCGYAFILFPFPSDPRDMYEELLQKAKDAGGNAVVDFQVRSKSFFVWMFPLILSQCVEASGTAATFTTAQQ